MKLFTDKAMHQCYLISILGMFLITVTQSYVSHSNAFISTKAKYSMHISYSKREINTSEYTGECLP